MVGLDAFRATRAGYDAAADTYAQLFRDTLRDSPLDRAILGAFAEVVRAGGDGPVADLRCRGSRPTGGSSRRCTCSPAKPEPAMWGMTPRESIAAACERRGVAAVIDGCIALIRGEDADPGLVAALAGPGQERYLDAPEEQRYWLRVWGARGLLWAGHGDDPRVAAAVGDALGDGHWRIREMAAKVAARHRIESCQPAVAGLLTDENARVRAAAARAVRVL